MSRAQPLFGELLVQMGLVSEGHLKMALARQAETGQRIGEALVSLGYVSRKQLHDALVEAIGIEAQPSGAQPRLGEVLVRLKHIDAKQLAQALEKHHQENKRLGEALIELGFCGYKQIYEALAIQSRMASAAPVVAGQSPASSRRVLVVDDSELALEVVRAGLGELGYEVVTLADPFQALEQVSLLGPSIILSDLEMPGMDGAELCRKLKTGPARAIPVILLTANDGQRERVEGLRAGADDYVNKSASMAELAARIDGVLRRSGETARMKQLFARYTSEAVVDEVLKRPGGVVLTGEKREVTILFADIRNFTGLAESLPPEQVVHILNEVLGRLADAVLTCGGTLDKFLGDGLMAVFGAPVRRDDDPLRAMQSARMMMAAVKDLNEGPTESDLPTLHLGLGINTGDAVVGNIGSEKRTEYTCIGDVVNVAARLCALAGPGEVLVGERTQQVVGSSFAFEGMPPVRLKGKQNPVPLFRARWELRGKAAAG